MAHLSELQARHRAAGLVVIGLTGPDDYGSTLEKAKKVVAQKGKTIRYAIAWDSGGKNYARWMAIDRNVGWPWAILVGRDGRIAWRGHPEKMDAALEKALAVP